MATVKIRKGVISQIRQDVTVNDRTDRDLWCAQVSQGAGLGGTTATFELPFALADTIGDKYANAKVVVRAGYPGAMQTIFIGYITGRTENLTPDDSTVSVIAQTAGHFLNHPGVGEDLGLWRYEYPLYADNLGTPTGWTPAGVMHDLFARLSEEWKTELTLGNVAALGGAWDLPVVGYDFSLTSYADAVHEITASLGDVYVTERFFNDKTYIDFHRISDPVAPRVSITVADFDEGKDANVATWRTSEAMDMVKTKAIAYGQDREFVVTCRSIVMQKDNLGQPTLTPTPQSSPSEVTALLKNWDQSLETIALRNPALCSGGDKIHASCTVEEWQFANSRAYGELTEPLESAIKDTAPGTAKTIMFIDCDVELPVGKTILTHAQSGERMLLTSFSPGRPPVTKDQWYFDIDTGQKEKATETASARRCNVTVQRMYAGSPLEPGDIKIGDALEIEIVGISKVFREYRLPEILKQVPKRHILNDLPILTDKGERSPAQAFTYRQHYDADTQTEDNKIGIIGNNIMPLDGCRLDMDKWTVTFSKPMVACYTEYKEPCSRESKTKGATGADLDTQIKLTTTVVSLYTENVAGVTFAYRDTLCPFGWSTTMVDPELKLPWINHTIREKLENFVYQQGTNEGWPILMDNEEKTPVVFERIYYYQDTGLTSEGHHVWRDDIAQLKTASARLLMENNTKRIVAEVDIPWLDTGFQMGYQLTPRGLRKPPNDRMFITSVTWDMPATGEHTTHLVADNIKPPFRKKWVQES